jgi:osmotically-inducible protein OsmY
MLWFALGVSLQGCAVALVGGAATTLAVTHDRRTTGALIDDQGIEFKLEQAISETQGLGSAVHVQVSSYNGVVLLTGEAPTEHSRAQIEPLVQRIDRVRAVHNEVQVAPLSNLQVRGNDVVLSTRVRAALLQINLPDFDATRVKVVTTNEVVYLMGLVSQREGRAAAEQARQIGGVLRVVKLFEYLD